MGRAEVFEQRLGDLPWLIVRGTRTDAFSTLGAHSAGLIEAVLEKLPDVPRLRARLRDAELRNRVDAIACASSEQHPRAWEELVALAEGAGVPFEDLLLLNLRGDTGVDAGVGCSDIAWTDGSMAYIAHNEDEDPALEGYSRLLTLVVDEEPPVTAWWTPGLLPANTWVATGSGLLYTVDHLSIAAPTTAAGRHFVARGIHSARTLDAAIEWLGSQPSAGGFTYTLGQVGDPRVVVVETGAGRSAVHAVPLRRAEWHANHLRYLPVELNVPHPESLRRGGLLASLTTVASIDSAWLLETLTSRPPHGVLRTASGGDELATHCTVVAVFPAGNVTISSPYGQAENTTIAALTDPLREGALAAPANQ